MTASEAMMGRKAAKQYHRGGRPVPFITCWTSEHAAATQQRERARQSLTGQVDVRTVEVLGTRYLAAADFIGASQAGGWWWNERPSHRGVGEPMWAEVHAGRQRSCMRRFRCQVCSVPLEPPSSGRPFTWLVSQVTERDTVLDPPTCGPCRALSQQLCPALRRDHQLLTVRAVDLGWGVAGTRLELLGGGKTAPHPKTLTAKDDAGAQQTVLAYQAAAQLLDFEPYGG